MADVHRAEFRTIVNFGHLPDWGGEYWPAVAAMLLPALKRDGGSMDELVQWLSTGHAQLWVAVTTQPIAALVTTIDGDTVELWLAGGAVLSGCVPFIDVIERAAIEGGMTKGRATGRKGWARVLRPWGWRQSGEDLVKDFRHG